MPDVTSYTSPDDARSDLFLSGAAYVFGGTLLAIIFGITGLNRVPGLGTVLMFVLPLVTTVLVPILLMRYRGETLRDLGLGGGGDPSVLPGLLAGLPIVGAVVVGSLLAAQPLSSALPVLNLGGPAGTTSVVLGLIQWLGVLFLAFYGTVKARDAFRGEPQGIVDAVVRIGRFIGIAAGAAIVLLILAFFTRLGGATVLALVVYPLGVAGAVAVALAVARGSSSTTLATVLTPVVLLALGPFAITFNAAALFLTIYATALYAGVGLVVAVLVERTRRGAGVLALGLVLGLAGQLFGAAASAL
jgi:hypothetical protein